MKDNKKHGRFAAAAAAMIFAALAVCCRFEEIHGRDERTVPVRGGLSISGAVPKSVADSLSSAQNTGAGARTAVPGFALGSYNYEITFAGEKTVTIENAEIQRTPSSSGAMQLTFEKSIPAGTYAVSAAASNADGLPVLESAAQDVTITEESADDIRLVLRPKKGASGSFDFTFNIGTGTDIEKVLFAAKPAGGGSIGDSYKPEASVTDGKAQISSISLPSGAYQLDVRFLDAGGNLKYWFMETVNIFDNLTTDTWLYTAGAEYLAVDADGNVQITITQELVDEFEQNAQLVRQTIFVDGENGDDSNDGFRQPLKTLAEAVNNRCTTSQPYTIYVSGTTTETELITIADTKTIVVKGSGETQPAIKVRYTAGTQVYFITVKSSGNLTLTLENVIIEGNPAANKQVGAIDIKGGRLTITGGTIRNFKSSGIHVYEGTLAITDTTITGCTASNDGGGISIGLRSIATITNSVIENCEANYGGGISAWTESKITITDSVIKDCSAIKEGMGNGIYCYGGRETLTISDGLITGCRTETNNTAINIPFATKVLLKGGIHITSDNVVYIEDLTPLYLAGELTSDELPVAVIKMKTYKDGASVLNKASGVTGVSIQNEKFTVMPDKDGIEWYINTSGKLKPKRTARHLRVPFRGRRETFVMYRPFHAACTEVRNRHPALSGEISGNGNTSMKYVGGGVYVNGGGNIHHDERRNQQKHGTNGCGSPPVPKFDSVHNVGRRNH